MRHLNRIACTVLDKLTEDLRKSGVQAGDKAVHVDNRPGTYNRVSVEKVDNVGGGIFSVAHYYEQNGDLVPDPEMTFWRDERGCWYPLYFRNSIVETQAVTKFYDGRPAQYRPRAQADLASFGNTWMRNIADQQGLR